MNFTDGMLKFFGVITLIIVTMFLAPVLVFNNAENVIFDREKVWQMLEESVLSPNMYEDLRSEMLDDNLSPQGEDFFIDALASMDETEASEFWDLIFPHEALLTMIHGPFDDFYDWFAGDAVMPEIVIDGSPIVDSINTNKADIFARLLNTQLACTQEETDQYAGALTGEENPAGVEPYFCRLPDAYGQRQLDAILADFDLEEITPEDVTAPLDLEMTEAAAAQIKSNINLIRWSADASLWVLLALWVIGGFLSARKPQGALRAFALPAFFGGAMTLVLGFVLRASGAFIAQEMINNPRSDLPSSMLYATEQLITAISAQLGNPVMLQGALLLAAALLAFITSPILSADRPGEEMPFYKNESY